MNTTNTQQLTSIEEFKQQAKELKKSQPSFYIHNHHFTSTNIIIHTQPSYYIHNHHFTSTTIILHPQLS